MTDTTTVTEICTTTLSPDRQAKLAVLGWLAQHNIPFEVGGRHLIRLFNLGPVNVLLSPFILTSPILSRTVIENVATYLGSSTKSCG